MTLHTAPADLRTIGERLDQIERELNDLWTVLRQMTHQFDLPMDSIALTPSQEDRLR